MKSEKIHLRSYTAAAKPSKGALLFVHGGFVDSTCWEFNFIPYFLCQGYDCFAVDLSGHGGSEGRDRLDDFGIDDYAEDLEYAINEIGRPVILIGHSMGSRVLERFLENGDAEAAIFMSPVPTTGTASSAMQLAWRYPECLGAIDEIASGKLSEEVADLMSRIYFSPATSRHAIMNFLPLVGPESQRAVAEMAVPGFGFTVRRRRQLPTLVVGGQEDAVFPASMLHFMGTAWNADVHRVVGAGHMLMLEPQWEDVAGHMLNWMQKNVRQSSGIVPEQVLPSYSNQ